jgi:lactoylglutathione lyase
MAMQPTFGYAIIYVPSVPEAVSFYERAFGFSGSFVHESEDYGELRSGATRLAFTSHRLAAEVVPFRYRPATPDGERLGVEFTLVTPDVDSLFRHAVDAGAVELASPHDTPWGQRVAYVADLNGFAVELATPMG